MVTVLASTLLVCYSHFMQCMIVTASMVNVTHAMCDTYMYMCLYINVHVASCGDAIIKVDCICACMYT